MDIPQIRKLKPALTKFLKRFDRCFPRKDTRAHLPVYVSGTNRIRRCMARREKVRVTIGKVLPPETWFAEDRSSTLAGRALYQAISDRVMREIALLARQQEETTRSGVAPATTTSQRAGSHERGGST